MSVASSGHYPKKAQTGNSLTIMARDAGAQGRKAESWISSEAGCEGEPVCEPEYEAG
jgi:hypothetical protein